MRKTKDTYSRLRGLRARITLVKSHATATGWVMDFTPVNALIEASLRDPVDPGDQCTVEVVSHGYTILAIGEISGELPGMYVVDLKALSHFDSSEPPRMRVEGVRYELTTPKGTISGPVHDVSKVGIGLTTTEIVTPMHEYPLTLSTPIGEVRGLIEVRYSRPPAIRTGGLFTVTDRVDRARWIDYVAKMLGE